MVPGHLSWVSHHKRLHKYVWLQVPWIRALCLWHWLGALVIPGQWGTCKAFSHNNQSFRLEGLYLSDSFVFHPVCKFPSPVLCLLPSALMSQKKRADKVNQSRTFMPTLVRASLFTDARVSPLFLLIHYSWPCCLSVIAFGIWICSSIP